MKSNCVPIKNRGAVVKKIAKKRPATVRLPGAVSRLSKLESQRRVKSTVPEKAQKGDGVVRSKTSRTGKAPKEVGSAMDPRDDSRNLLKTGASQSTGAPASLGNPLPSPLSLPEPETMISEGTIEKPLVERGSVDSFETAIERSIAEFASAKVSPSAAALAKGAVLPGVTAGRAPTREPYDENTALRLYLRDAVEVELLKPEQEIVLAGRIQAGDEAAREHMIRANLRLVVKIAREYEDFGLPLLDLINEGNIGLMHAVERFDPTKGAKLSTYAAWWIKQSIRRALSNQSKAIRLPIHVVQELARMKKAENRLEAELGRMPSEVELAAELEATVEDIQRWREAAAIGATSLDAPLGSDPDSNRIADVVADENASMPWSEVAAETDAALIRDLVTTLNAREQTILKRRFALDGGEPETLETIGESFGLTRERIRQLEAAALKKLRDRLRKREALQMAA